MKSTTRLIVYRECHVETVTFDVAASPRPAQSPPTSTDLEIGFVAIGARRDGYRRAVTRFHHVVRGRRLGPHIPTRWTSRRPRWRW